MTPFLDWFLRGRCLKHAEPLFDRDAQGHAMFRCPRCLATWEILPGLETDTPRPAAHAHVRVVDFKPKAPAARPDLGLARRGLARSG